MGEWRSGLPGLRISVPTLPSAALREGGREASCFRPEEQLKVVSFEVWGSQAEAEAFTDLNPAQSKDAAPSFPCPLVEPEDSPPFSQTGPGRLDSSPQCP